MITYNIYTKYVPAHMTLRRPARLSDDGESGRENFPARKTLKIHETGKLSLPRPSPARRARSPWTSWDFAPR